MVLRVGVTAAIAQYTLWARDIGHPFLGQANLEDELVRRGIVAPDQDQDLKVYARTGRGGPITYVYPLSAARMEEKYQIPGSYWRDALQPSGLGSGSD